MKALADALVRIEQPPTVAEQLHVLRHDYQHSKYGQMMADAAPRFSQDDSDNVIGAERFIELLGHDVNHARHMCRTLDLTRAFIRHQNQPLGTKHYVLFSTDEAATLLLAAQTHDWAEAIVGDISYPDKTADDDARELKVFTEIFDELVPDQPELRDKIKAVVFDEESVLGDAFRTVERIGYTLTGLRAFRKIRDEVPFHDPAYEYLATITKRTFAYHIPKIESRVHAYRSAALFMGKISTWRSLARREQILNG